MHEKQYFTENDFHNTKAILECSSIFSETTEALDEMIQNGQILFYQAKETIIQQHTSDQDVFFILAGLFDISIDGNSIAVHGASDILGEMAIVDSDARRTATVTSKEASAVLKIEEEKFVSIANMYPKIWQNIAAEIARRLRKISGINI